MNCFGTILENFTKTPIQFWIKLMIMMLCTWAQICITERFCAGHFTCKNTDWEKWHEPIRKVEPETTDWALHTRIPVRIEPSHFLTAAECWSIGPKILKAGIFTSAFLFFLIFYLFCFTKMTRSMSSSPAPDVFPSYLFIYLFIFICLPRRRRHRPCRRCHRLRLEKTLRFCRDCLPRSRYIGCVAPAFLPGVLHRHSQLPRKRRQLEIIMSPFFVTMMYDMRKREVERSLRGTQDYVSFLRIVDT